MVSPWNSQTIVLTALTVPYVLSVTPDPARFIKEVRRVSRAVRSLFSNHFSGSRFWWILERLVLNLRGQSRISL